MKIKIMSFITALLLAVLLLLTSCGDDANPIDSTSPNIQTLTTNIAFIGQAIIIKGKNFGAVQDNGNVSINGVMLHDSSLYTWSDNRIVIIIPTGAVSGSIAVNANSKTSNSVNLTINALPETTSPFVDYLPQDIAQPRQSVTIMGKNFGNLTGAVEFNGIKSDSISFWGSSKITVTVPDDAITGKIVVYTYDSVGTNTAEFRVQSVNQLVGMVKINPGTFTMGTDEEDEWYGPAHSVQITNGYYIGKFEVSQIQYKKVMNFSDPSRVKGDSLPVERVSWLDAVEFCNELSKMENYQLCYTINGEDVTCNFNATGYRLPTEAEWEYACRAGTTGKFAGLIDDLAWTNRNADNTTHIVGTRQPNAWGIYDMHGNVWEWCWDQYDALYYTSRPIPDVDPKGPTDSEISDKVIRGGSYIDGTDFVTSSARDGASQSNFTLGFRVVRKVKN